MSYNDGFVDGIFNRPCKSPYPEHHKSAEYLRGYLDGEKAHIKYDIKPLSEV